MADKIKKGDPQAVKELSKRQQEMMEEEQDKLKEKMDNAGLTFVDNELPDEELNMKDVQKSFWESLKGLWPYSDEYYEAQAAEEEMDNLKAIRVERARAEDLLAMTKTGKHEEALESMMAETNNDFFFFNKLKYKLEGEGKWEFEEPELNPFGVLEAQQRRNRIRRAFRATYSLLDEGQQGAMDGVMASMNRAANGEAFNIQCTWKGKNDQGVFLICKNDKFVHPHKKDKDKNGKEMDHYCDFCPFHMAHCVEEHDPGLGKISIRSPNEAAMCSECHMTKRPGAPLSAKLTMETVKGVEPSDVEANRAILGADLGNGPGSGEGEEGSRPGTSDSKAQPGISDGAGPSPHHTAQQPDLGARRRKSKSLNDQTICAWVPNKRKFHERTWQCGNCIIRKPDTGELIPFCGWHAIECCKAHTGGTSKQIKIPNQYGLCEFHHTAEYGEPPKAYEFPYPGMIPKKGKNAWMKEGHHWAAPKFPPLRLKEAEEYEEPDPPEDFIQAVIRAGKIATFHRNKRRFGKQMATVIQSFWRMWTVQSGDQNYINLKRLRERRHRLECCILLQSGIRRKLAVLHFNRLKALRNKSATMVQALFRGYWCRRHRLIDWGSRRIQKFMRRLNFFKFRDAVILMMQLKKLSKQRHGNATKIQRVIRGYLVRVVIFQQRLYNWVRNRAARVITREIRSYGKKVVESKRVRHKSPGEDWAKKQCGKRIAKLIWVMIGDRIERDRFMKHVARQSVFVQRHVRGFIARKGTHKMRFLRAAMKKFIKAEHATEFIQRFFESKVFYLKDLAASKRPPTPVKEEPTWLLRPYLDEDDQKEATVGDQAFYKALQQWYAVAGVPLLQSEVDSLRNAFAHPASGKVEIALVEDYIKLSKLPCRRHGRHICGSCLYKGKCRHKKCLCDEYAPTKANTAGSICKHCFHTPDLHQNCPLQMKESTQKRSMLTLMRSKRDPDMSIPASVTGVDFDDIIVPPEDPDDVQLRRDNVAITLNKETFRDLSEYRASTLTLMLMFLEEKGENIASIDEYWGQHEVKLVGDLSTDLEGNPVDAGDAATVNVNVNALAPDYNLTLDEFWNESAKNPNKSTRDYDEKFEHNMPMPVISNYNVEYTFEGMKVYLNVLIHIIDIGEGKVPNAKIHYDNPDFMRLVMNHIQIFERHWRKMVADIREGQLNRNVLVDESTRKMYQALALPRPKLATLLDDTFRDLGFHKKVLGKDIQVQKFATRWRFDQSKPRARRPSLPKTPSLVGEIGRDEEMRGRSRGVEAIALSGEYESPAKRMPTKRGTSRPSSTSPMKSRPGSQSRSRPGSKSRSHSRGKSGSPTRTKSPHDKVCLKGKSRKELLVIVGDEMKGATAQVDALHTLDRSRGPSRRSRGDGRRGSDTDILRDTNSRELHALHTEQETEPRTGYHFHIETASNGLFICPFPACGKTFKSKDAAFRHLPIHEQKIRLFAPTALADSHLNVYWPKNPPWQKEAQFRDTVQPAGNCPCTWPGCGLSFANKDRLANHIRLAHGHLDENSSDQTYYKMLGNVLSVPPYDSPPDIPARYCKFHMQASGNCLLCIELEKAKGPKPPYRFYPEMTIDLKARVQARKLLNSSRKKKDRLGRTIYEDEEELTPEQLALLRLGAYDYDTAVNYTKKLGMTPVNMLGVVVSIMVDKTTQCFIGIRPLLTYTEALMEESVLPLPRDYDKANELMALPDEVFDWDYHFQWINVNDIVGTYPIYYMDRREYKQKLKQKKINKRSYFIRPEAFSDEEDEMQQNIMMNGGKAL